MAVSYTHLDVYKRQKLGRAWQNAAGSQYRYYMVFQNKDLHLEGAYRFDEFLKILGEL